MKNYKFLLSIFLLFTILANAQVRTKFNNQNLVTLAGKFKKQYKESTIDLVVPSNQKIKDIEKADSELNEDRLLRIAIPISLDIDFTKVASWINDTDFSYGKLILNAANAKSISLNFNKFLLPEGTEMYIYNENGNMITGPITAKENNKNKIWGSSIYKGGKLTIEVKIPLNTKSELLLNISNIAYGYKKVFYDRIYGFGQSETCNINILCPLGNAWQQERYSVALLLKGNGTILCSGAMVNNTCNVNIPYFLTANHCFAGENVAQWRFVFQYWSPQCTPNQDDLNNILFNGSTLKANYDLSDFCLVELNQTPDISTNIAYAGWNRSATPHEARQAFIIPMEM
jgi:lysyl endopeptidase